MNGSQVLQFVLLISFVIFSTHALKVYLTDGDGANGYQYKTTVNARVDEFGRRYYDGNAINNTYKAGPATTKVIVYIKSFFAMTKLTLRKKCRGTRVDITQTLSAYGYELLYLAVTDYNVWDHYVIGDFLRHTIEPDPGVRRFRIETIAEKAWNQTYGPPLRELNRYQEEPNIFGKNLLGKLKTLEA